MSNDNQQSPNDQRANVKNPNNPDYEQDIANRKKQGHTPPPRQDGGKQKGN